MVHLNNSACKYPGCRRRREKLKNPSDRRSAGFCAAHRPRNTTTLTVATPPQLTPASSSDSNSSVLSGVGNVSGGGKEGESLSKPLFIDGGSSWRGNSRHELADSEQGGVPGIAGAHEVSSRVSSYHSAPYIQALHHVDTGSATKRLPRSVSIDDQLMYPSRGGELDKNAHNKRPRLPEPHTPLQIAAAVKCGDVTSWNCVPHHEAGDHGSSVIKRARAGMPPEQNGARGEGETVAGNSGNDRASSDGGIRSR